VPAREIISQDRTQTREVIVTNELRVDRSQGHRVAAYVEEGEHGGRDRVEREDEQAHERPATQQSTEYRRGEISNDGSEGWQGKRQTRGAIVGLADRARERDNTTAPTHQSQSVARHSRTRDDSQGKRDNTLSPEVRRFEELDAVLAPLVLVVPLGGENAHRDTELTNKTPTSSEERLSDSFSFHVSVQTHDAESANMHGSMYVLRERAA
jgi:hypothetical protein